MMIELNGYKLKGELYNGSSTLIYKAQDTNKNKPVVIKILKAEYPDPSELKAFEHEYNITSLLKDIPGVIQVYDLLDYKNSKVMVTEDFGGESLDKVLKSRKISIKSFLVIAIKIIKALKEIHSLKIIHKDIKPHNILVNLESGEIKIIDFGISSQIQKEMQTIVNPDSLEGTLAYISPEQTGRMNRSIDYRTDFYSLGITFYELLTNTVPFKSDDPMEIVHMHIARKPDSPANFNPAIPPVIGEIILKLLEKNAENRYVSCQGLLSDLENCYSQLKNSNKIESFPLGLNDLSDTFRIPEKLYGRPGDIKKLLEYYTRIKGGGLGTVVVHGKPGIGKTSLINEAQKQIVENQGMFLKGKFDRFKKNIPYTGIIQAFQEIIKQIIMEKTEVVETWKRNILFNLEKNGQLLIDIIPELEMVIGAQPAVEALSGEAAQNRLIMVFQNFIKVFARKEHPLVLFLDDMQWADNSSLQLLSALFTDESLKYFMLLSSYRTNEVGMNHPLRIQLDKIRDDGFKVEEIDLGPLPEESVSDLLCDTLCVNKEELGSLNKLIYQKTDGNPFFIIEFLNSLNDTGLIYFENGWKWKAEDIENAGVTDNIIDLMTEKIKKIPATAMAAIKVACCIGVKFYLDTLAEVLDVPVSQVFNNLLVAINEGMVLKLDDNSFQFIHDRIREAAYSLLSEEERQQLHYKIGKRILATANQDNFNELLFSIANQWNLVADRLSVEEKSVLFDINLKAGKKSLASAAYDSAVIFLKQAVDLAAPDAWDTDYARIFDVNTNLANSFVMTHKLEEAENVADLIIERGRDIYDKVEGYCTKIQIFSYEKKYAGAIKLGTSVVRKLGEKIPVKCSMLSILGEFIKFKGLLGKKGIEAIKGLPVLTDKAKINVLKVFDLLFPAAQITDANFLGVISLRGATISLENGNNIFSAYCYGTSAFLCCLMGDLKTGFPLLELSDVIAGQFDNKFNWSKALIAHNNLSPILRLPIRAYKGITDKAMAFARETGNFEYLSYYIYNSLIFSLNSGLNLENIYEKAIKDSQNINKLNVPTSSITFNIHLQGVHNWVNNPVEDFLPLEGEYFSASEQLPDIENSKDLQNLGYYHYMQMLSNFISGNDAEVVRSFEEFKKYISQHALGIGLLAPFYYVLSSFSLLKVADCPVNRKNLLKDQQKYLKFYKKWALSNAANFYHKYLLIAAEYCGRTGHSMKVITSIKADEKPTEAFKNAMELYELAIETAKENQFTHEQAIANECAGKYFLALGLEKIASTYMIEARYCYLRWGCRSKVEELEKSYRKLFTSLDGFSKQQDVTRGTIAANIIRSSRSSSGSSTGGNFLDLSSVLKASNVMASEIRMESLLSKTLGILMENAGAQKGFLILPDENSGLFIEAEAGVSEKETAMSADAIKVLHHIPLDGAKNLAAAIVRYVSKTRENVVLDNASAEGRYINDEYVKTTKPKSVLCVPVVNQGRLNAILYLENNLMPSAFPERRVELLGVLCTQAAISIENARLISNLTEQERLKKEMEIAERIQTSLCPPSPEHDDLEIAAAMIPCDEVGGDYYDILFDKNDNLWFAIGDVTGHGVTPGLIMMMAQTAFNTNVKGLGEITPKLAMDHVNQILFHNIRDRLHENHFMTMNFVKYKGNGDFIQSGSHEDIIIWRAATGKCEAVKTRGVYLGITEDISKALFDDEFTLNKGDIVIFYTDGIIEARNADDQLLDPMGFFKIIESNASKGVEKLKENIISETLAWCNNKVEDDITLIVAKRK